MYKRQTLHDPKILKVNDYWVDVKPEGHMCIAKYEDVPGSIGKIGTALGEYGINIGIMQVEMCIRDRFMSK